MRRAAKIAYLRQPGWVCFARRCEYCHAESIGEEAESGARRARDVWQIGKRGRRAALQVMVGGSRTSGQACVPGIRRGGCPHETAVADVAARGDRREIPRRSPGLDQPSTREPFLVPAGSRKSKSARLKSEAAATEAKAKGAGHSARNDNVDRLTEEGGDAGAEAEEAGGSAAGLVLRGALADA
jgi:hypothetical protein